MTTTESHRTTEGRQWAESHLPAEAPYFWRAPFARETYREFGYVLGALPIAIAGYVCAITLLSLGAGTLVTVLGFPVLALLVTCARGFGRLERDRIHRLLGHRIAEPAPVRPAREGAWGAVTARLADPVGWKAVAHQVLIFPWTVLAFSVAVSLWATAWSMALLPVYSWVFPTYVGWPGYKVFDYTGSNGVLHVYYLSSVWQIAGVALAGILLLFLLPALVRLLNSVNLWAARTLLAG